MADRARVLIVDDSRIFRSVLEEALTGQDGIAVAGSVFSGAKALEFIQVTPPDVVTLDVEMPGLGGLETLEAIQRGNTTRPRSEEIGVIMVSAFTKRGADVTVRALQAGAFDFVTKPNCATEAENLAVLRTELVGKIRLFLARRSTRPAPPPAVVGAGESRQPQGRRPAARPVRAVVIAASTGGPRALTKLLPQLCGRVEVPVFVVQHITAGFTQSLAESLAQQTHLSVVEAADGVPVQAGTVYIAPSGSHLLLRRVGGEVRTALNDQPPENGFRPSADVLFRSAASAYGGDVVAAVLTGLECGNADGTAGLRPLKRAGGYVIAQDEASSVVWGMPGSVVQAGLADEVLPLDRIADAVAALAAKEGALTVDLSRTTFDELRRLIHRLCGLVLAEDKAYLIRYRLEPVARDCGCRDLDEFVERLCSPAGATLHDALIEAITTAETSFFRDAHPFETFRREILPRLGTAARARRTPVRIWCTAAATGQEPYSLAMLLYEYLQANRALGVSERDFRILATDVSAKVLASAAAAEYSEWEVGRGLTNVQMERYFEKRGERWVLCEPVRRLVEFRRVNLLQALTGLGNFDVIVCRNVLIYFDTDTRRRLCEQFHALLTDDGWLLLGSAESLYGVTNLFESQRLGETLLYRKARAERK